MKNRFYIILIISIFLGILSCNQRIEPSKIDKELHVFWGDSLMYRNLNRMTINKTDTLTEYYYNNLVNAEKDLDFKYYPKSNRFKHNFEDYNQKGTIDISLNQSKISFKKFRMLYPEVDGTEIILFNQEYGVLAVLNSYAPDLIFTPTNEFESIYKEIISVRYE